MATKYFVDTHALVWHLEGNPRPGSGAKTILADPNSELVLPIITLAEACWMVEHGKSTISNAGQSKTPTFRRRERMVGWPAEANR